MKILVINCGSSSLKFQLIDSATEEVLGKGLCERIGIDGSVINFTPAGKDKIVKEVPMPDHNKAIELVIAALTDKDNGVVSDLSEIGAVGHRIVHGGEAFTKSVIIDDQVISAIEAVSDLAPLHNPANLIGVRACQKAMPGVPMVAVVYTLVRQLVLERLDERANDGELTPEFLSETLGVSGNIEDSGLFRDDESDSPYLQHLILLEDIAQNPDAKEGESGV